MAKGSLNRLVLEMLVEASLSGHELTPFEEVDGQLQGHQAKCKLCGQTVWVNDAGLMYSLLDDACTLGRMSVNK